VFGVQGQLHAEFARSPLGGVTGEGAATNKEASLTAPDSRASATAVVTSKVSPASLAVIKSPREAAEIDGAHGRSS
jgi:hypothetical protein